MAAPEGVTVAVTDHAVERFRQRVGSRRRELVVITLWEEERLGAARVPKRFTNALKRGDERGPES